MSWALPRRSLLGTVKMVCLPAGGADEEEEEKDEEEEEKEEEEEEEEEENESILLESDDADDDGDNATGEALKKELACIEDPKEEKEQEKEEELAVGSNGPKPILTSSSLAQTAVNVL
jgi:hypothetical protein